MPGIDDFIIGGSAIGAGGQPTPLPETAQYIDAIISLLPRGRAWPRDLTTVIRETIAGLAPTYARNQEAAEALLVDAFPATAVDLLPEWEESVGLPDPCAGAEPTIPLRQAQVVARFAVSGGQTPAYFIALAAKLGYAITITEYAPFRVGMRVGRPLAGVPWAYAWQVNASLFGIQPFRVGINRAGDRLATFGNAVLECELNAVKPSHTILRFSYT